jgi:hypothetical protein
MTSDESRWALIRPRVITIDGDRVAYRIAGKGPVLLFVYGMAGCPSRKLIPGTCGP